MGSPVTSGEANLPLGTADPGSTSKQKHSQNKYRHIRSRLMQLPTSRTHNTGKPPRVIMRPRQPWKHVGGSTMRMKDFKIRKSELDYYETTPCPPLQSIRRDLVSVDRIPMETRLSEIQRQMVPLDIAPLSDKDKRESFRPPIQREKWMGEPFKTRVSVQHEHIVPLARDDPYIEDHLSHIRLYGPEPQQTGNTTDKRKPWKYY